MKENESIKSCEQYLHSGKHCIDSYVIGGVVTDVRKGMGMVCIEESVLPEGLGFVSLGEVLIFPLDAVEAILYDISEAYLSVRYILNHAVLHSLLDDDGAFVSGSDAWRPG